MFFFTEGFKFCKFLHPEKVLNWWPFRAANSYRLRVPTVYVQIRFPFTNSFSRIIFINSLSPIFFYKFNIMNSFSRINLRIRKSSKKFVRIRTTSFWFVFAKSVLRCERPVSYVFQVLKVSLTACKSVSVQCHKKCMLALH